MDRYVVTVIDRADCKRHNAIQGMPCFYIPKGNSFGHNAAICGRRAKRAGYIGVPSSQSLRTAAKKRR